MVKTKYKCDECDGGFLMKDVLETHKLLHSDEISEYVCKVCEKIFTTKRTLNAHIPMHNKIFSCPECKKRFPSMAKYEAHYRCHTGERPYKCKLCEYTSATVDGHRIHQVSHSEVRNCVCETCGKSFKKTACLTRHRLTHIPKNKTNHKCEVCDRAFKRADHLVAHRRLHFNVRPYECKICGRRFVQNSGLYTHMKLHSEKKDFLCTVCRAEFVSERKLMIHIRQYHDAENKVESSTPLLVNEVSCKTCEARLPSERELNKHITAHHPREVIFAFLEQFEAINDPEADDESESDNFDN